MNFQRPCSFQMLYHRHHKHKNWSPNLQNMASHQYESIHGLWTIKPFHWNPELLVLGRQIGHPYQHPFWYWWFHKIYDWNFLSCKKTNFFNFHTQQLPYFRGRVWLDLWNRTRLSDWRRLKLPRMLILPILLEVVGFEFDWVCSCRAGISISLVQL